MSARVALQLYSVREHAAKDYVAAVEKIAAMGYAGVETSDFTGITPQDAAKLFQRLGLTVTSSHTALPVGEQAQQVIDVAKSVGTPVIISGKGPDDFKTLDAIKRTCDLFNQANANAKAAGLRFGVHNHWWEFTKVDDKYPFDIMLGLIDPDILLEVDTYWVQTAGADPAAVVGRLGKRAALLHIKDGPAQKNVPMMAVGDGVVDVPAIVKAGGSNTEWLIVEIDRVAGDMMEAVAKSCAYLVNEQLGKGR